MEQPPGFAQSSKEAHVWELHHDLYGVHQSLQIWCYNQPSCDHSKACAPVTGTGTEDLHIGRSPGRGRNAVESSHISKQ